MKEPKAIRDVLIEAAKAPPIAVARNTSVYSVPDFNNILLRTQWRTQNGLVRTLKNSTALMRPVYLCQDNFGQIELTSSNHFQLVRRVNGVSLAEKFRQAFIKHKDAGENAGTMARRDIYEQLLSLPDSTFENFLSSINVLTKQGIVADIHGGNILLDEDAKTLKLIDVHPPNSDKDIGKRLQGVPTHNALSDIIAGIFSVRSSAPDGSSVNVNLAELREQEHLLKSRIVRCAHQIGLLGTKDEIKAALPSLDAARGFTDISRNLGKLSLDDNPHAMREMLRKVETYSAPQR